MKLNTLSEKKLLDRAFLLGVIGISLCVIPLVAINLNLTLYTGWINGLGIACQLVAMSLAVLVIRKRKISKETQQKAKQMTMVLAVSLLFFFLI